MEMESNLHSLDVILRSITEILNDIIDIEIHKTYFLNKKMSEISNSWHYIRGFKDFVETEKERELLKLSSPLQRSIRENRTIILKKAYRDRYKKKGYIKEPFEGEIWIPLNIQINERIVGVLRLIVREESLPSEYSLWLSESLVTLAVESLSNDYTKEIWDNLRYSVLHRKHHYSGVPKLNDILNEYINRFYNILNLPYNNNLGATVRLIETDQIFFPTKGSKNILKFCAQKNVDLETWGKIKDHICEVSDEDIHLWLKSYGKEDNSLFDIDNELNNYLTMKSKSNLVFPSIYNDKLVGLFSFSTDDTTFNINDETRKALAILAAHAAPIIANAKTRSFTTEQRDWMQAIVNGIGDELIVIDDSGKILLANEEKKRLFKHQLEGEYCFNVFEKKNEVCDSCPTLKAIYDEKYYKLSSWEYFYNYNNREEKRYVEITAGPIKLNEQSTNKAVEIVRDITSRERMLKWFENIHKEIHDNDISWLYKNIVKGLVEDVGFGRARLYLLDGDENEGAFIGEECYPSCCDDKFSDIKIEIPNDEASEILIAKRNPIHFIVDQELKKIKSFEDTHSYTICYLERLAKIDIQKLEKEGLEQFVEIPILMKENEIIGKIAIDNKGRVDLTNQPDENFSVWDLALLTMFSRFTSLAVQLAKSHENRELVHKRKLAEIDAIKAIDEHLITGKQNDELLLLIVEKAHNLLDSCTVIIRIWDDKKQIFTECIQKKPPSWPGNIPHQLNKNTGLSGRAIQERNLIKLEDARADNDWTCFLNNYKGEEKLFLQNIGSTIVYPLLFRDRILGTIAAAKRGKFSFDDNDELTLELLAHEASAVIEYKNLQSANLRFAMENTHALRGPLVPMAGYIELIRDGLANETEIKKYCNIVLKGVSKLNQMTSELIRNTEIETGHKIESIKFSVWEKICNAIESIVAFTGIKIETKKTGKNDYIQGMPDKFEEVIKCLLHNAINYSKQNPNIRVIKRNRKNRVIVEIIDHGIGMTEDDLDNIFNRFYRGSHSNRMDGEEVEGTGLGAYIAKDYVEKMGGKISYNSKPNEGTKVMLSFPIV